jgi:type II secretory pathway pseudopilin PulG
MRRSDTGFTLVELLVAACITLLVTAAVVAAMGPAEKAFEAQSESADLQQRARVAANAIYRDLLMAGAGPDVGLDEGPLALTVPSVLPGRPARAGQDAPGTFRADAITLIYVPSSSAQTTTASELVAASGSVRVNTGGGCAQNDGACGLSQAVTAIVYDSSGSADVFRVEGVSGSLVELRHTSTDSAKVYAAGSRIAGAMVRSYFLRVDAAADTVQLMRDDHDGGPVAPVVDHVVGLTFEYFGDPLEGEGAFPPATLADGPWRPDEVAANRFDADLLRVRTIGVRVRVESALSWLRGPAGVLFSRGGTAASGSRFVPDQEFNFRISPKNMRGAR